MKTIPLTQGRVAMVDDCDYKELSKYKWHVLIILSTHYYAARQEKDIRTKKQKVILMHRQILNASKGMDVDHHDHYGLNNRRYNLRLCTHSQNLANQLPQKNKTSQYKGVYWHKGHEKWHSKIKRSQKNIHLGYFHNEIEAAKCYDTKAKELFNEFAHTNF